MELAHHWRETQSLFDTSIISEESRLAALLFRGAPTEATAAAVTVQHSGHTHHRTLRAGDAAGKRSPLSHPLSLFVLRGVSFTGVHAAVRSSVATAFYGLARPTDMDPGSQ